MSQDEENLLEKDDVQVQVDRPSRPLLALQSTSAAQSLLWLLNLLRPSFLGNTGLRGGRLRRTAYLDGIRGFAALLVYWHHHNLWAHEALFSDQIFQSGFGWRGDHYFITLPFVRDFFVGGHISVATFLVISGYVLSTKPLALLDAGEHLAFSDNVASALFRRWFRLWIPIILISFSIVCIYYFTGIYMNFIPEKSFKAEVWKWYCEMKIYTFIYGHPKVPWLSYHPHTWTIPAELRGSMIVYLTLMALSRATRKARLWCTAGMIFYFMYITDGAWYSMFLAGTFLADIDMHLDPDHLPEWMYKLQPYETIIWPSIFVAGLYLAGVPSATNELTYLRECPGWYYASFFVPQAVYDFKWFFLFFAAIFIVISVPRIPILKRFFEGNFCQYLGRISYMLYLFHGPILWSLGDRLYAAVGWTRQAHALHIPGWVARFPIPRFGPLGAEPSFFIPHIILLPVTLWFAEMGVTLLDTPSMKFGSWLYSCIQPSHNHLR